MDIHLRRDARGVASWAGICTVYTLRAQISSFKERYFSLWTLEGKGRATQFPLLT